MTVVRAFHVRVNGDRLFRITPLGAFPVESDNYVPVDCRDVATTMEAQSIVEAPVADSRETLLADEQTRDAIRSAYGNAVRVAGGEYVHLPDDFTVTAES